MPCELCPSFDQQQLNRTQKTKATLWPYRDILHSSIYCPDIQVFLQTSISHAWVLLIEPHRTQVTELPDTNAAKETTTLSWQTHKISPAEMITNYYTNIKALADINEGDTHKCLDFPKHASFSELLWEKGDDNSVTIKNAASLRKYRFNDRPKSWHYLRLLLKLQTRFLIGINHSVKNEKIIIIITWFYTKIRLFCCWNLPSERWPSAH